jgi:hypothetical protein
MATAAPPITSIGAQEDTDGGDHTASPEAGTMPAAIIASGNVSRTSPSVARLIEARMSGEGRSEAALTASGAEMLRIQEAMDRSEVVFGIPMEDTGMQKVMKRVIVLAAVAATFYTCLFVSNLLQGAYAMNTEGTSSLWTAISSLLIELSVPACGYWGALHRNRQLTCCFCSCNLFVTFVSIVAFIRLNIRIGELDGDCHREKNQSQRRTCEIWNRDGAEKYLMVTTMILLILTGCLAFWFGNSLYQRLAQEFSSSGPPLLPLVGEVVPLNSFIHVTAVASPAGDEAVANTSSMVTNAAAGSQDGEAPPATNALSAEVPSRS